MAGSGILRVLIVEDDPSLGKVLRHYLKRLGHSPELAASFDTAGQMFVDETFDLVLLDLRLDDKSGMELLERWCEQTNAPPIVVMTGENTPSNAIDAMGAGAYEYLVKPFDLQEIDAILGKVVQERALPERIGATPTVEKVAPTAKLIGRSAPMQDIYKKIGRYSRHNGTVLILGENGVGKELVANAIHASSDRNDKPFVALNMSAIPDSLLESELFGYEKGAFTGADKSQQGKFRQANGGTLFLDEIGDMSVGVQAKLLRVLQEREVMPVGGTKAYPIDVRIVAATQVDLAKAVQEGEFRQDLFFRLNVLPLHVPPLRERASDIPELVEAFVAQTDVNKKITDEAVQLLASYSWPGNVRELQNVVQRVVLLCNTRDIGVREIREYSELPFDEDGASKELQSAPLERWLVPIVQDLVDADAKNVLPMILDPFERVIIVEALELLGVNQVKVADFLGVNRNTLRKRIRHLDIDIDTIKARVRTQQ